MPGRLDPFFFSFLVLLEFRFYPVSASWFLHALASLGDKRIMIFFTSAKFIITRSSLVLDLGLQAKRIFFNFFYFLYIKSLFCKGEPSMLSLIYISTKSLKVIALLSSFEVAH